VTSRLGESTVDAPLPLYAPARIHVLTDRPLYKAGDSVQFRAVVLRASDLTPLDGRPGTWFVESPAGDVLLEERAPAADWGVVSGTFPLDRGAPEGEWKVRWVSASATDEVRFRVEPFTLPRFRIEASATRPFYRAGDRPHLDGNVTYSSGAPVAGADVAVTWSPSGEWPVPTAWVESTLPKVAKADASGHFTLELPVIPADLRGQATLIAELAAVDPAGDRVEGSASLLLSEDPLRVSAVTEMGEALVHGFNNRLYLRLTTADGTLLPRTTVRIQRAWDSHDQGVEATTDEDGVAALQMDPGPPVNVIIPPMPVRPAAKALVVTRLRVRDTISSGDPSLSDQLAMDRWNPKLAGCERWADGAQEAQAAVLVDGTGVIRGVSSAGKPLDTCIAQALKGEHLPAGHPRLFELDFRVDAEDMPKLSLDMQPALTAAPDGLMDALNRAVLDARTCLPQDAAATRLPRLMSWSVQPNSKRAEVTWQPDPEANPPRTPDALARCIEGKLEHLPLPGKPDAASEDDEENVSTRRIGFVRFQVQPTPRTVQEHPQATTYLGYEFRVSARSEQGDLGTTKFRVQPGTIPPLRFRTSPVIAEPGQTLTVELLRGPDFREKLPEKLYLTGGPKPLEAKLDPQSHRAEFKLADDAEGWREVALNGARSLVFVKPKGALHVEVNPDKARYAPGETAKLAVLTSVSGKGAQAAVGLFGVDQSLAQLVALPGPDDMVRIRPKVGTSAPAFGVLDGQALAMGRIQGANAAAATVLRVSSLPAPAELESPVSASGTGAFDGTAELTDHFYAVLAEVHAQAETWEEKAPKGELMHPPKMAELWKRALDACAARGQAVDDAYGRRLRLSVLPQDLLALVDPRAVIVEGTRLPEDVEAWSDWVAKEKP
jgi:hypothetical protein